MARIARKRQVAVAGEQAKKAPGGRKPWPWAAMAFVFAISLGTQGAAVHAQNAVETARDPAETETVYGDGLYDDYDMGRSPPGTTPPSADVVSTTAPPFPAPSSSTTSTSSPTQTTSTTGVTTSLLTESTVGLAASSPSPLPSPEPTEPAPATSDTSTTSRVTNFVANPLASLIRSLERAERFDNAPGRVAINAMKVLSHGTFPLALAFGVGLFLRFHRRIDRNEAKLEVAPMYAENDDDVFAKLDNTQGKKAER